MYFLIFFGAHTDLSSRKKTGKEQPPPGDDNLVYIFVYAGGAQPPQVTGWELALVSEASQAKSAPSKRVHHSHEK